MIRFRRLAPAASLVLSLHAFAAAELPYRQQQNVVYAEVDGVGLLMDVFTPAGPANGLAVVDVVSGAWSSDRAKLDLHIAAGAFHILCGRGYTVFAVRPGSITKFSAREMVANDNRGLAWVGAHAEQYDVDAGRLGLMGASAGGHLALLAAVTASSAEPSGHRNGHGERRATVKAVGAFFPPTDLLNWRGGPLDVRASSRQGRLARQFVLPGGGENPSDDAVAAALKAASPARLVTPQAPPTLLIHGDADDVVPLEQSEAMRDALQRAGVPVELIVKPGGGHPWWTLPVEVAKLADWFDRQLAGRPAAASSER